ncbi:MAG: TolC family protein [Planctomycetes bacterium]|nr:TolC family protein [Planctomycetota bacterium]
MNRNASVPRLLGVACLLALAGCGIPPVRDLQEVRRRVVADVVRIPAEEAHAPVLPADEETPAPEDPFGPEVKNLDLHAVLLYALDHSPRIQAARYRFHAAEARERAAGWLPDPHLTWSHGFEEIQTRNGPIRNIFSLTQTFPYYGKLSAERDAAGAQAAEQREDVLATELEVLRDVQQAYFDLFLTAREIEINDRTRGILERFVRVAQSRVASGKGGQLDILLAETELLRLENERIDLDQREQTQKALLNTLLARKPSAHLPPASPPQPDYRADVDALIAWSLENLPDLRRHRRLIEENEARLRMARLRYVPDVTVGVTYTDVGQSPIAAGAVHSGRDAIGGMVGISVPLWLPKYSAEAKAARQALEASRSSLADVGLLSVYRILEMHVRVETALRRVELLRDQIIPKAYQTIGVLQSAYETGAADFLKLLDAERTAERFELEHERARAEFEKRLADLERAVGKVLRRENRP